MEEKNTHFQMPEGVFYRTGSTQPPKSRSGMLACTMVVLILVAGSINLLSLVDVHLTRFIQYANRDKTSILVQNGDHPAPSLPTPGAASAQEPELDIMVEAVEIAHQQLYDLPAGVLVTQVTPEGHGHRMGLQPGDILLSVNGDSVSSKDDVSAAVRKTDLVRVELKRAGQQISLEWKRN